MAVAKPLIPRRANAELVTLAYVRDLVNAYDTAVGATLQGPDPETGRLTWARGGFIETGTINDPIDPYVPVRPSIVSLDIYAAPDGQSKKPPWGLAFSIAELIVAATFDTLVYDTHKVVTLPQGYPNARVTGFRALTGPSRLPSDQSDWAHVSMNVEIAWHGLSDTWSMDQEP